MWLGHAFGQRKADMQGEKTYLAIQPQTSAPAVAHTHPPFALGGNEEMAPIDSAGAYHVGLRPRPDAERGVSVGIQLAGVAQGAMSTPSSLSAREKGWRSGMVTACARRVPCRPRASALRQRTARARKDARLPAAARSQTGQELSAREASAIPATSSAVFVPLIFLPACILYHDLMPARVAPPSDTAFALEGEGLGSQVRREAA